jgi:pimeloyl-ACP methyl ester carboxylesterase
MPLRGRGEPQERGNAAVPQIGIDELRASIAALEPLNDRGVGVGYDFSSPSTTVLVSFAAMGTYEPPPFDFFQITSGMPVKRLFVRDVQRIWYHRGVPGFGDSIEDVARALKEVLDAERAERVIVFGSSAGGYAALVFGTLLDAELVVAFAPQTMLDRDWLASIGDERWYRRLSRLDELGGPDARFVDLAVALPRERRGETPYEVHYPASHEGDEHHARHLEGVPGLRLCPHERRDHKFVRKLRDSGELEQVLRAAVGA